MVSRETAMDLNAADARAGWRMSDGKVCPQTGSACETLVSLREYIEAKLSSMDKALTLQERAIEVRLSGLNEYRDQAKDEAKRYATLVDLQAVRREIEDLKLSRAELAGKASGGQVAIAQLIALAALVISAVGLFVR